MPAKLVDKIVTPELKYIDELPVGEWGYIEERDWVVYRTYDKDIEIMFKAGVSSPDEVGRTHFNKFKYKPISVTVNIQ